MAEEKGTPSVKREQREGEKPMNPIWQFFYKSFDVVEMEARKIGHDPTELLSRAIQPALWLLLYGEVMTRARWIPTGSLPYIDFIAPGILAQSVLFIAVFYGISAIRERDLGIVHKFLVTPTPRSALVLGKALSAGVRGLSQMVIIYLLAAAIGVSLNLAPENLFLVLIMVVLISSVFSTFSLAIASVVKTQERFMGLGQALTMPLFFASNAIYPVSIMPPWLRMISEVNPLTYQVDALRYLMIAGGSSSFGVAADFLVSLTWLTLLTLICAKLYGRLGT